MQTVEKFIHAGVNVTIYVDEDPPNPREYDNLVTIACWHRRENLGDRQIAQLTLKEMVSALKSAGEKVLAILPVYLYQHSGMTMKTTPFSCRWDSGQVGWAYVTASSAVKMGCVGPRYDHVDGQTTPVLAGTWDRAAYEKSIRDEVETYDLYLTGQCYGYEIEGIEGDFIENIGGFLGDIDDVRKEACSEAKNAEDPAIERGVADLESRATFASVGS